MNVKFIVKEFLIISISVLAIFIIVKAGNIDSPAVPATDTGRMYTLEQIYQTITSGTTATKQSGGFTEPSSSPGSTMHTLDDIYAKLATGITDAVAGNVLATKTFISRTAGSGETAVTGTMTNVGAQTITPTTSNTSITTGYHNGSGYCAGDTDLVTGNIKSGVNLFGVDGSNKSLLPTTSLVLCYDTDGGDAIACGGTDWPDQDADTSGDSGSCTPTYTQGTYTVTDSCTNLEWQRYGHASDDGYTVPAAAGDCDLYSGTYSSSYCTYTWQNALKYCSGLSLDGHSDWRLPNAKELQSIVKYSAYSPAIDTTIFTNTKSDYYWSSTTYANSSSYAWSARFLNGTIYSNDKTVSYYVRCVRQY